MHGLMIGSGAAVMGWIISSSGSSSASLHLAFWAALLHKSVDGRRSPYPGQTYPASAWHLPPIAPAGAVASPAALLRDKSAPAALLRDIRRLRDIGTEEQRLATVGADHCHRFLATRHHDIADDNSRPLGHPRPDATGIELSPTKVRSMSDP